MFITITRSMLRRVAAAAAAFAVVAALFMMFPQGKTEQTAAADGNWGLSVPRGGAAARRQRLRRRAAAVGCVLCGRSGGKGYLSDV